LLAGFGVDVVVRWWAGPQDQLAVQAFLSLFVSEGLAVSATIAFLHMIDTRVIFFKVKSHLTEF
jgi:hypothetical protein